MAQTCPNCGHAIHEPEAHSLTPAQANVLRYIARVNAECGVAPTFAEIARERQRAGATTHEMIETMILHGWLSKARGAVPRSLTLTDRARRWLASDPN